MSHPLSILIDMFASTNSVALVGVKARAVSVTDQQTGVSPGHRVFSRVRLLLTLLLRVRVGQGGRGPVGVVRLLELFDSPAGRLGKLFSRDAVSATGYGYRAG